nr:M6 family metalloprotease domain-containing protein [Prevotella sp.]
MKKILLSITFALMGITSGFAAKAYPGIVTVTQSDGTELNVRIYGDEHHSWYTTTDGALLVQIGKNFYVAQVEDNGMLKATPQLAHNAELRNKLENKAINTQNKQLFFNTAKTNAIRRSIGISNNYPYFPHTDTPKALVILVEFQDCAFLTKDPVSVFNHLLNASPEDETPQVLLEDYNNNTNFTNTGSVKQYFSDMSEGEFQPQFDVKGVVKVSKNYAYYGQDQSENSRDIKYKEMIKEACELAKSQLGVNFSEYDANNDGNVDLVYVIHAGYGQNTGGEENTLWAKTSFNYITTIDGKEISAHGINSELNFNKGNYITGIGVICHEFSHTMGIPDLYPYNSKAYVNNQEPESWDLMDAGEYGNNGYTPVPYCAWELDIMGWNAGIETLDKEPKQITMEPYFSGNRKAYKIEADNGEYLLLQNLQRTGWGKGYMSHGLLIYRIDYQRSNVGLDYRMNQTPNKPEVTVLPADGVILNGYLNGKSHTKQEYYESQWADPFPGYKQVTELLEAKLNNTTLTNLLYNIKETDDRVITFDYLKDYATGIDQTLADKDTEKNQSIFSFDGRYLGNDASKLTKGVYIIGKKKVVIR